MNQNARIPPRSTSPIGCFYYLIQVEGWLSSQWTEWFDGLTIEPAQHQVTGQAVTIISGWFPDQSALYGILSRLSDLGLTLVSVQRVDPPSHLPV